MILQKYRCKSIIALAVEIKATVIYWTSVMKMKMKDKEIVLEAFSDIN